jgi:hypothetical protein
MRYRCEAASVSGFIQQLAVAYVARGYFRYVVGTIPQTKDPRAVDTRIVAKFGIQIGKASRARRKQLALANLQYLRYGRFFLLLATDGYHPVFSEESEIRDVRRMPIKFGGYAISYRGNHVHVRIEQRRYLELKAYFLEIAAHRQAETIEHEFRKLGFEPYAPVRGQLFALLRAVNERRKLCHFESVPSRCIRVRRRIVLPFGELSDECGSTTPLPPSAEQHGSEGSLGRNDRSSPDGPSGREVPSPSGLRDTVPGGISVPFERAFARSFPVRRG